MFRKTFVNDLGELPGVARELRDYLVSQGVSERNVHAVDLAVEELVGNAIRHGYPDGAAASGTLEVRAEVGREEIRLRFVDDGRAFDPTRAVDPPDAATLEEAPIGGLGIKMVRHMIPDMRYARTTDRNELFLTLPRDATGSGPRHPSGSSALPA